MKKTTSIQDLTPSILLDNLAQSSVLNDAVLSAAAKSAERVAWTVEAINENRLSDFFLVINDAIETLPKAVTEIPTIHPVSGKHGTKKLNYRDNAKKCFKTAWKGAVKENKSLCNTELKFKISLPYHEAVAKVNDTEKKIERTLSSTIDGKGLEIIMATIALQQQRHAAECVDLAVRNEKRILSTQLGDEIASIMMKGRTNEQAQKIAAAMNDITVEELQTAIS